MELKYFQLQIMNERARRCSNHVDSDELGYIGFNGESKLGTSPCQKIKSTSKLRDFYLPSSDLGSRIIISTQVKNILEEFRDDNLTFIHCPLTNGTQLMNDFWITDVKIFNDEVVDFERSQFKLIEGWIEKEVNGIATEFGERVSEIHFDNVDELKAFEKENLNYLSTIKSVKLALKEDCKFSILYLKSFGIFDMIISSEIKNRLHIKNLDKGVEFKPLEIPGEEWYGPNGIRKEFYK